MKDFRTITVIWKEAYGDTPVKIREENFDPERHVVIGEMPPEQPEEPTEDRPRRSIRSIIFGEER